ncbi:hypothetical protein AGLY_015392 [Aphis glycines]|uniref:Uncharacterized protein n=1 Tax=Aphis glycines TaxID=307491 RepID=A0A6G0T145_APHGL|nr:hypothetical protein AGLY_015392 [Aphis glycines]
MNVVYHCMSVSCIHNCLFKAILKHNYITLLKSKSNITLIAGLYFINYKNKKCNKYVPTTQRRILWAYSFQKPVVLGKPNKMLRKNGNFYANPINYCNSKTNYCCTIIFLFLQNVYIITLFTIYLQALHDIILSFLVFLGLDIYSLNNYFSSNNFDILFNNSRYLKLSPNVYITIIIIYYSLMSKKIFKKNISRNILGDISYISTHP